MPLDSAPAAAAWLMAAAAVAVGAWLGGMAAGLRRARMPIYDVAVPDGDSERT